MMWDFEQFSSNDAVITEDGTYISYAQLEEYCCELAAKIPQRQLVFSFCSNTIGSLIGYITFLHFNIVPLMLDQNLDQTLLNHFLNEYKPDFLWLPECRAKDFDGEYIFQAWGYVLLKCTHNHDYQLYNELALLLTTSGSTGSPKFVRQSYDNIKFNTQSIVKYLNLDSFERAITTLPMNYTYGLSIINSHLSVGATVVLTEKTLVQREFWDQFARYEATSFGGVPYTYEMLNKLFFFRRNLPSLHTMTQAGGKLLPDLHKKFAEYALAEGKKFVVMYGAAEATARMGYLPPEKALEKCGSMGIPVPGGKFTLIDENGCPITEAGKVGELVYEGRNVALGYSEHGEDLSKGDEWHGKLRTGDMACFDEDGFFYIVGRKKRFLKIFGNRVGLDETERLIKAAYPDCECACAGKDDALYVFLTDESKCEEVKKFLTDKMKLNSVAFHVKYLGKIPKNDAGKTLYTEFEQYYD